ncbi:hypothetical protein QQX98_001031 [Neonectria punicea]|uniref:Uncharacterized protein n=1 Tax=Neonectria punicea TaxID=979145 RepID=A0ABR1HS75_9HYPO
MAFRRSSRIVSLVFFCGCHLLRDECHGGAAMILSLVAQLLQQVPSHIVPLDPGMPLDAIGSGDIQHLCRLFVHLMRQLPPGMTVFCLIDGIDVYEREEYFQGMAEVVRFLLALVKEGNQAPGGRFKLLLTSPNTTLIVRKEFDPEPETLLHLAGLPRAGGLGMVRLHEQLGLEVEDRR